MEVDEQERDVDAGKGTLKDKKLAKAGKAPGKLTTSSSKKEKDRDVDAGKGTLKAKAKAAKPKASVDSRRSVGEDGTAWKLKVAKEGKNKAKEAKRLSHQLTKEID